MDEEIVIYRANTSSTPSTKDELAYLKDDLIRVAIPKNPQSATGGGLLTSNGKYWFKAINSRTKHEGYVTLNNNNFTHVDSSKNSYLPLSLSPSSSSSTSMTDASCIGSAAHSPAVTIVSTMASLSLTKSSKESNTMATNMQPQSEDIYIQCVNPTTQTTTVGGISRDYIWGLGVQGQQCKSCWSCFHIQCVPFAIHQVCQRNPEVYPKMPATFSTEKSINEWTSANVLEWMAALNLYTYADVFKAKDIKGCDLTNLDRDKLAHMGIKNEFHQQTILACIKDLLNSGEAPIQTNIVILDDNNPEKPAEHGHEFVDHSFSKLEKCDKCSQMLRGLIHQGKICKQCKLIVHRQCSTTGLRQCLEAHKYLGYSGHHHMSSREHVFGLGLCHQFNVNELPAPKLVIRLCNDLEQKAMCNMSLDLYKLYRTTPANYDEVLRLRDLLNDDVLGTDLTYCSPECVATVLKKFLRELPDPIIPVQWYDHFVEASKSGNDKQSIHQMMKLVQELPEHHSQTLVHIMKHLIRICRMQYQRGLKEQPIILIQVWCHIIMRPPWEKIVEIVYNSEAHLRIMELLLYKGDWDENLPEFASAPAVPPRKISRPAVGGVGAGGATPTGKKLNNNASSASLVHAPPTHAQPPPKIVENNVSSTSPTENGSLSLKDAEWYWGNITRDEAKDKMMDSPDGSFLVRDATSGGGEYTLTLKKDGTDRVIKIYHTAGKYGFTRECTFNTVVELINFFRNTSLKEYNTILDIKLLYPVSRVDDDILSNTGASDMNKIVQKFIEIDQVLAERTHEMENINDQYMHAKNQVDLKKQAHEAIMEAEKMFSEQLCAQTKYEKDAQPHEKIGLQANNQLITERMGELDMCKTQLVAVMNKEKDLVRQIERSINKLKPEILQLIKQKDRYQEFMKSSGMKDTQIKQIISEGYCAWVRTKDNQEPPHHDEANWLRPNCSRSEAESYLANKPTGTFLIRARRAGHYALSITCNDTVNHCIIHETERGFGFAEPYNIYDSLKSLVLHYAFQSSLEEHNDLLQTTLKYPVFHLLKQAQSTQSSSSSSSSGSSNNFMT